MRTTLTSREGRWAAGRLAAALVVIAAGVVLGAPVVAQDQNPPPAPVVVLGNAQFTQVFDQVALQPGEKVEQDLDVMGYARISVLAAATADAPANGHVAVRTHFGPPAVPVNLPINLAFRGGTEARGSATHPVLGPHLHVAVVNQSTQAVTVSLSVYAVK